MDVGGCLWLHSKFQPSVNWRWWVLVNCSWKCQPLASLLFKLHMLKSHTSPMQDLVIEDCFFSRLLDRVGFPIVTLKALEICDCDNLGFLLPELFRCHHPALEELKIGSHTLRILSSFTFTLSFSLAIFPGLIQFDIDSRNGLESLSISISEGEPTSLRWLKIIRCYDLGYIELPALDSACYEILECEKLKLLALTLSSLQKLSLKDCPQLLFYKDGLPSNLRELEICKYNQLTPQVNWGLQRLTSLTEFKIRGGCQDVESFPEEHLLPSHLFVWVCKIFLFQCYKTYVWYQNYLILSLFCIQSHNQLNSFEEYWWRYGCAANSICLI